MTVLSKQYIKCRCQLLELLMSLAITMYTQAILNRLSIHSGFKGPIKHVLMVIYSSWNDEHPQTNKPQVETHLHRFFLHQSHSKLVFYRFNWTDDHFRDN